MRKVDFLCNRNGKEPELSVPVDSIKPYCLLGNHFSGIFIEFYVTLKGKGEIKMDIKILGTGCKKCKKLEENVREAVNSEGMDASVEKVEDMQEIMEYGVMSTPALVIDGKVKSTGKILTAEEIIKLF